MVLPNVTTHTHFAKRARPSGLQVIVTTVHSLSHEVEIGPPIRVILADDHTRHRHVMALVLQLDGRIAVVGEAANGAEAISRVRELDPDVVLLDARMPVVGGIEACARIARESPRTQCIMLTMADDRHEIAAAFAAGAKGYIGKTATSDEIVEEILRVARTGSTLGSGADVAVAAR